MESIKPLYLRALSLWFFFFDISRLHSLHLIVHSWISWVPKSFFLLPLCRSNLTLLAGPHLEYPQLPSSGHGFKFLIPLLSPVRSKPLPPSQEQEFLIQQIQSCKTQKHKCCTWVSTGATLTSILPFGPQAHIFQLLGTLCYVTSCIDDVPCIESVNIPYLGIQNPKQTGSYAQTTILAETFRGHSIILLGWLFTSDTMFSKNSGSQNHLPGVPFPSLPWFEAMLWLTLCC